MKDRKVLSPPIDSSKLKEIKRVVKETFQRSKGDLHIIGLDGGKRWSVLRRGSKRAMKIFSDKGEAATFALQRVKGDKRVVFHKLDGAVDFIMRRG